MREFTIQIHSDHPDVEHVARAAASLAAEQLGQSGRHGATVNLFRDAANIDAWEIEAWANG